MNELATTKGNGIKRGFFKVECLYMADSDTVERKDFMMLYEKVERVAGIVSSNR
jgi:hypothetical protein